MYYSTVKGSSTSDSVGMVLRMCDGHKQLQLTKRTCIGDCLQHIPHHCTLARHTHGHRHLLGAQDDLFASRTQ